MNAIEILLTKAEVIKILRICPRTLDRLKSEGQLRAIKVGRSVRFTASEINRFIADQLA